MTQNDFVIKVCNFSIKAILNYLEKFKLLDTTITYDLAVKTYTNIGFQIFEEYTNCIKNGNLNKAITLFFMTYMIMVILFLISWTPIFCLLN